MEAFCNSCKGKILPNSKFCHRCGMDTSQKKKKKILAPFRFLSERRKGIAISLILLFSILAAGMASYGVYSQPKLVESQVSKYVQEHKEELRGERGEQGFQGFSGRDGQDGYSGNNSLNCTSSSYSYSNTTYTNCY